MSRLRMIYLRWREEWLLAQVLNGEALMRDHQARTNAARRELEKVQRLQIAEMPPQRILREAA